MESGLGSIGFDRSLWSRLGKVLRAYQTSYNRCPPITGFIMLGAGDPITPELGGAGRLAPGIMLTMTLLVNGAGWLAELRFG